MCDGQTRSESIRFLLGYWLVFGSPAVKEEWAELRTLSGAGVSSHPLLRESHSGSGPSLGSPEQTTKMQIRVLFNRYKKKVLKYPRGSAVLFALKEVRGRVKNPSVAQWAQSGLSHPTKMCPNPH